MEANSEKLFQLKIFRFGQEGRFGGKFAEEKLGRPTTRGIQTFVVLWTQTAMLSQFNDWQFPIVKQVESLIIRNSIMPILGIFVKDVIGYNQIVGFPWRHGGHVGRPFDWKQRDTTSFDFAGADLNNFPFVLADQT